MTEATTQAYIPLIAGAGMVWILARLLLPLLIRLAGQVGAVDVPADGRRMHKTPVPRTGGIAVFLAFYLALPFPALSREVVFSLLCGIGVVLMGILDDVYRLAPLPKLLAEFASALAAVGFIVYERGSLPLFPALAGSRVLSVIIGSIWVVGIANAHNMIDGVDGLCAFVSLAEGAGLCVLLFVAGGTDAAIAAGMLAAALPAFLRYNFRMRPARVFFGDTGSGTMGFLLGVLALFVDWSGFGALGSLTVPLLFCLPLSDLLFAVVRRSLAGKSPFAADRGHWHHRLYDRGLGVRAVTGWLTAFAACGALLALSLSREAWYPYGAFLALWGVGLTGALWFLTERKGKRSEREDL